jgi:hypothetical protein
VVAIFGYRIKEVKTEDAPADAAAEKSEPEEASDAS